MGHLGEVQKPVQGIKPLWEQPMLRQQKRIVLRNCGIVDPENLHHYIARGGFTGLLKSFDLGEEGVMGQIKTAGLRGKGNKQIPDM